MRSAPFALWPLALSLAASGCVSESADLGHAPPIVLATPQSDIGLPASSPRAPAPRRRIARAFADMADGAPAAVRIRIVAPSPQVAEGVKRILVRLGADPSRVSVEVDQGRAARLIMTRTTAELTPCAAAIAPVEPDDPLPSLLSLAHCTQDNNLADMLVDPGDLVSPPRLAAEDGAYLVRGVDAWRGAQSGASGQAGQPQAGAAQGSGGGPGASAAAVPSAGP